MPSLSLPTHAVSYDPVEELSSHHTLHHSSHHNAPQSRIIRNHPSHVSHLPLPPTPRKIIDLGPRRLDLGICIRRAALQYFTRPNFKITSLYILCGCLYAYFVSLLPISKSSPKDHVSHYSFLFLVIRFFFFFKFFSCCV
eukprot:TRINITY_DN7177_c0_g1_i1.p1 TRINITY_DN7177_c0_g1~~TRINITY_DN7177_c0_g1_i1.p1  ORF type:complete len:140 (-),score=13.41 TRINITY_DN7177_c0_g1_i1:80-499(-)